MNLGPHALFIIASYGIAVAVIAGLAAWVALDYRTQLRALSSLEARGVTRRSERTRSTGKTA
ncbi:MAG TPA: heme exporter protein CcmD [Xanthobacteraceae bacterium]|jgi:heme exporter protein D